MPHALMHGVEASNQHPDHRKEQCQYKQNSDAKRTTKPDQPHPHIKQFEFEPIRPNRRAPLDKLNGETLN
jgi:hypothetical protein